MEPAGVGPGPPVLIVRREAFDRYAQLRAIGDAEGVPVVWDRRVGDRRRRFGPAAAPAALERRRSDRRRPPPITWRTLDFVLSAIAAPSGLAPSDR